MNTKKVLYFMKLFFEGCF